MNLIYLFELLVVLFFIILLIFNKKDRLIKKIFTSFFGSLYITVIIGLNILATINDIIFELLLLICFTLSFIYNKNSELITRFYKSTAHSLFVGIITFLIAISFLNSRYDMQDLYPNTNIFKVLEFLGYTSIYIIPLLYIFIILLLNQKTKK